MTRGRCSVLEAAVVMLLMLLLAILVYGVHVVRGGFVADDWVFASDHALYGDEGIVNLAQRLRDTPAERPAISEERPVTALYFAVIYTVFDARMEAHLAWALFLAALMSAVLFTVLRSLGLERLHAGLIAGLVLVFPAADAPRLWSNAAHAQLAIVTFGFGVLLALRGLRSSGWSAIAFHVAALACYGISVLQYEIAVGGIVLSVLIYRLRAPWRAAFARWAADLALVAILSLYRAQKDVEVESLGDYVQRGRDIQGQARRLLTYLGIQDGRTRLPLLVVLLVLIAGAAAAFVLRDPAVRREVRRWLAISLASFVAIGAGYVAFLPTQGYLFPLEPGIANRVNLGAAPGYVIVIYSLAMLTGLLLAAALTALRPLIVPARWAIALPVVAALSVGGLWAYEVDQDRRAWDRAFGFEQETLNVLSARVPTPVSGSTIFTFGVPAHAAPKVPAFSNPWALTNALRLLWRDASLRGIPSPIMERNANGNSTSDWGITCAAKAVQPGGWWFTDSDASSYGKAIFVDVPNRRYGVIRSREECRAWAARYGLLHS